MHRVMLLSVLLWAAGSLQTAAAACTAPSAFMDTIKTAQAAKRSVQFFLQGQTIALLITEILDDCTVVGRNQRLDRVVIDLNRVAAVGS